MPPKRQESSIQVKRKAEEDPSNNLSSKPKRTKSDSSVKGTSQIQADQSNTNLIFAPRTPNTLRIATWNVCSWAACQKKGFKPYIVAEDPDIIVLTETKVNDQPIDPSIKERFPYMYWSIADKKGYSGTAILSKQEPLSVTKTLPGHPDPTAVKGRIITLEFENSYLIGTYVVNAGEKLKTLEAKNVWNQHFTAYIRELDAKKPVIWTGDLNVAPTERDLSNAKKNWNKTPGYTEAETSAFKAILDGPESHVETSVTAEEATAPPSGKFVDVWRQLHPETVAYTYFSYRFNCRAKGLGWRLDMFVLSERIANRAKLCEIRNNVYGSDHVPLIMEIEGSL